MIKKLGAILLVAALALSMGLVPAATVGADPGSHPLVGLWHFDEGEGTIAYDSSGNANDGTVAGADWTTDSAFGNYALSFEADYVYVAQEHSLEPAAITVEAWVKAEASPGNFRYIVSKDYTAKAGYSSYAFYTGSGGGLRFYIGDATTFRLSPGVSPEDIWDGKWHHIAGTYDGSTVRLYVDGSEVETGTPIVTTIDYDSGDLFIGAYNDGAAYRFAGLIDEVRIWETALTADQIGKYPLTVKDDIGDLSGVSAQSGWYDEWADVHLQAPLTVIGDCTLYVFAEWLVGEESQGAGVNEITVVMAGPQEATATYTALKATETAWAAEDDGGTRFVEERGQWATYIQYEVGEGTGETPVSYPLLAGQHHDAGVVLVWDDGTGLYVRYVPKVGYEYVEGIYGEWVVEWTHLHVADDLPGFDDVRTSHRGSPTNPIPGRFDFNNAEGDYKISLDGLTGTIVIAAHAEVKWCPIAYAPTADGMVLWLDASAITLLDGQKVELWEDLSGWGKHATGYGYPTYKGDGLNGRPVVSFDGENDYALTEPLESHLNTGSWTVLAVIIPDLTFRADPSFPHAMWGGITHGPNYQNGFLIAHARFLAGQATDPFSFVSRSYSLDDLQGQVLTAGHNEAAKTFSFYKNGASFAADLVYEEDLVTHANSRVYLMSRGSSSARLVKGDIAEILIYDRALDDDERELVEDYLMAKYNL